MCGRYYIEEEETSDQLRQIIAEAERSVDPATGLRMKRGEIFPTDIVPTIAQNGYRLMKWGYSGFSAPSRHIINARSETLREKPMFRCSLETRRCLIPASNYFEWQRTAAGAKTKRKFAIYTPDEPLFMAGLWREEADSPLPVFVILTRNASEAVAGIHNRMPVILPRPARHAWVGQSGDVEGILGQAIGSVAYEAV